MVSKTLAEAQSAGDVLGLKSTAGVVVPRRDIDDLLLNEPNTFNLFLLALIDLKEDANRDSKMGFYQLAGEDYLATPLLLHADLAKVSMACLLCHGTRCSLR
jgi:hypothetical protein